MGQEKAGGLIEGRWGDSVRCLWRPLFGLENCLTAAWSFYRGTKELVQGVMRAASCLGT